MPWDLKFDVLIFADVLEHVMYPEQVLNYFVSNYLKENGKVIISLPNIANWQVRIKLLFGNFDYTKTGIMDKTHLHLYTFKSTSVLIKSANLRIEKVLSGASVFGPINQIIPILRGLLATNIIFTAQK